VYFIYYTISKPIFAILGVDCGKVELVVNAQYASKYMIKRPIQAL
jgi:hypothetical protein